MKYKASDPRSPLSRYPPKQILDPLKGEILRKLYSPHPLRDKTYQALNVLEKRCPSKYSSRPPKKSPILQKENVKLFNLAKTSFNANLINPLSTKLKKVHNEPRLPKELNIRLLRNTKGFVAGAKHRNLKSPRVSGNVPATVNNSINCFGNNKIEDYTFVRQIGKGAYAIVKEAIHKTTGEKVAIKVYDKLTLLNPHRKKNVTREVQILQKLSHKNVVKLYETIDSVKELYLVMECIEGMSLYSKLKSAAGRRFTEMEARDIFRQILLGIQYCHSKNISHRDIKLENILITNNNEVKIIDFGFSTCYSPETKLHSFCGTPSYMAPEIIAKKEYNGPSVDVWALGVLLYTMVTGSYPFKGENEHELYTKIGSAKYDTPLIVSRDCRELIKKMLQVDPSKRPMCEEVLKDGFMVKPKNVLTLYNEQT
jgi:MAP/microtubule affinity-regulating kinase